MLLQLTPEDISSRIDKILSNFYMSPSAMKKLDSCQAYYILERVILPKIEPEELKHVSLLGRTFHKIAETDFNHETAAEELSDDTTKVKKSVKDMGDTVRSREYFQYPSTNEVTLRYPLRDLGDIMGIIDRLVIPDEDKCKIVDYKTTANINPDNEIRQMLTYAYLAWKNLKYKPEDITVILDYVSEPEPLEYKFTEYDLKMHENYMISRFRLARKLLESFKKDMDLKKLVYSPGGSCSFCPMTGSCLPYSMWVRPGLSITDPAIISTVDLIKEKLALDETTKLFEERLKVINRTLLFRHDQNIKEPNDEEDRLSSEIISKYMKKISSQIEEYDTKDVISKMVTERTKKMVKKLGLMDNIDLQQLNVNLVDMMIEYLPARLDKGKVPADMYADLHKSRFYKQRAAYLKYKK